MRNRRWLAVAAVAGVVVAHAIDFLVVYRGDPEREHQLLATGHGYWPVAVVVAVFAGLLAFVGAAGRGGTLGLGATTTRSDTRPIGADIARLAAAQMVLFASVELLERVAAGVAPATLVQAPEFVVGLVLQVVVAALAVVILLVVERVSEKVIRSIAATARQRMPSGPRWHPHRALAFAGTGRAGTARPRAPPRRVAA